MSDNEEGLRKCSVLYLQVDTVKVVQLYVVSSILLSPSGEGQSQLLEEETPILTKLIYKCKHCNTNSHTQEDYANTTSDIQSTQHLY